MDPKDETAPIPWHQLLGLSLKDIFHGTSVHIELEKDLSLKQQMLDIILIRKDKLPLTIRPPDGFDDLATHNLVTFKSFRDTLDAWAISELIGHYVNYRKQTSDSMKRLLPETDFRLFAVTARYPRQLANKVELTSVQPGVYEMRHTEEIRVIVVNELPLEMHNSRLHLFSSKNDVIKYGADLFKPASLESSTLLMLMVNQMRNQEKRDIFKENAKRVIAEFVKAMPPEERFEGISVGERFKGVSMAELFAALTPAEQAELLKVAQKNKNVGK